MTNYLAFDLEIAKPLTDETDWKTQRPLGITCAAAAATYGIGMLTTNVEDSPNL